MKKLAIVALFLLVVFTLSACSGQPASTGLQLAPAELTEEEKNVLSLLGDSKAALFDFTVDESIRSVRVERYELSADGTWQSFGGGSFIVDGASGRLALSLNPTSNEIRLAIQDDHGTSAIRNDYPVSDFTGMSMTSSLLASPVDIVPDQEIPLMVQILTNKNEVHSYTVEYFFHPEEYTKFDYEHVYAITVTFSSDSLS